MSSSGFPSTATISASFPSASEPIRSAIPSDSAATDVPLSNASMGLSPPVLHPIDELLGVAAMRAGHRVGAQHHLHTCLPRAARDVRDENDN